MGSELHEADPRRLGDYEITARLGAGGQGTVYFARGRDDEPVAVKVLDPHFGDGDEAKIRSRFAREVQTARRVAPFCTAAILDADVQGDPAYIVTEYVAGPTLREAVLNGGPRQGPGLDRLAIATATALVAIHQADVVHRDFKPANVLLGPDGPRVIDFGIAQALDVTATKSQAGTPSYMAPEQIKGEEITPKVDVFAWACVIAFAARGDSPFSGDSLPQVAHQIISAEPRLDGVPERLRPMLERCLSKDPRERPASADLLTRLLGGREQREAEPDATSVMRQGYAAATAVLPALPSTATEPAAGNGASAYAEPAPAATLAAAVPHAGALPAPGAHAEGEHPGASPPSQPGASPRRPGRLAVVLMGLGIVGLLGVLVLLSPLGLDLLSSPDSPEESTVEPASDPDGGADEAPDAVPDPPERTAEDPAVGTGHEEANEAPGDQPYDEPTVDPGEHGGAGGGNDAGNDGGNGGAGDGGDEGADAHQQNLEAPGE